MSDDRLDKLDYYTLLQAEEDAKADAIRDAFHLFALKYHPDRFAGAPAEKRERAAHIYRRGAEGYRVLMDPAARKAYDAGLNKGELRMASDFPSRAPGSSPNAGLVKSVRARPFAAKAMQAFKLGDLRTAELNFKMALQHEPGNALLVARIAEVEEALGRKR